MAFRGEDLDSIVLGCVELTINLSILKITMAHKSPKRYVVKDISSVDLAKIVCMA
jgi:hypothetical protein